MADKRNIKKPRNTEEDIRDEADWEYYCDMYDGENVEDTFYSEKYER